IRPGTIKSARVVAIIGGFLLESSALVNPNAASKRLMSTEMNDTADRAMTVAQRMSVRRWHRTACVWLALLIVSAVTATLRSAEETKEKPPLPDAVREDVDFEKQIAPLLEKRCVQCHGADKQKSGFRLDTREVALKGGNSGEVIQLQNSA